MAQNTSIYISQPAADGTETLTVDTGGTVVVQNGSLQLGSIVLPPLPTTNGYYRIQITGGNTAAWVTDAS